MERFLMCAPNYFGVEYVINPWMEGKLGGVVMQTAHEQWQTLYNILTQTLAVETVLVPPQPGLPDIVFTANAASVRNGVAVPARFRYPERQGEEPFYRKSLLSAGYTIRDLPSGIAFEGAGDALFYDSETEISRLFAAHGFRTDRESHEFLAQTFGVEVVSLQLVNPCFYHLDTCFCPLPGGFVLWHPAAFDSESQEKVRSVIPADKLYAVSGADATAFACNAVGIGNHVVMNAATESLKSQLLTWGLTLHTAGLSEFMKAGGSAKCLTLRLG